MRYRMLFFTVPGLAVIVSLVSCGSEQAKGGPSRTPTGVVATPGPAQPMTELTVEVKAPAKASSDAPIRKWSLTCDPPQGTHPDPAAACAALGKSPDPFAPVPKDQQCTMIFGGPEEATVTGTWKGKRVDAKFSRKNGCEMSRWSGLAPVFGKLPQTG
jgi:hypothetical protein